MNELSKREQVRSYENFNVAVYYPVMSVIGIKDLDEYQRRFELLEKNVKIGRVYLECYRGGTSCDAEQLRRVKDFFNSKGIAASGGITTSARGAGEGYASMCYSDADDLETLYCAVRMSAELFDEIILDDFYFANCRCEKCIAEKGERSWAQFRLEQKRTATREMIRIAKEIKPDINFIIKFPQWYDSYNETGYDIVEEPRLFDSIYTGTETRNPQYSQQHLPKYLSYFIMRYLESAAPGRNLGGWFDPYECTYNITSYLEQGYLTLFGKAREVTLFCSDSLTHDPRFSVFAPAVGQMLSDVDKLVGLLGNPVGAAAYRPGYSHGEDNLHNYLGMCGIPLEGCINYPDEAVSILLTESAADDKDIIEKMKKSLSHGADITVTSGFVRRMGNVFADTFVNVRYSPRKAIVSEYCDSRDNGLSISGCYTGAKPALIPQLDYYTNDVWELAGAYGSDNNFPIVLRCRWDKGHISVITIPDDPGDLYSYPAEVLNVIRSLFTQTVPVIPDAPSKVMLFAYDNDRYIVRSDLPYDVTVRLRFRDDITGVKHITGGWFGRTLECSEKNTVSLRLSPGVNVLLEAVRPCASH